MGNSESPASVKGDRALLGIDADRLGFRDVAARIAKSLVDHASDDGLVIGVEGSWGSGKSSLLNLIQEELSRLPDGAQPTIINFKPWLLGNRDALLGDLFSALASGIDAAQFAKGDATGVSVAKAKEASETVRKFAARIGVVGEMIEVAGDASAIAPVKWIGSALKAVRGAAQNKPPEPSLTQLKDKITASLRNLGHRFIITIDDVDRLEPAEVIEVLRLARSVADFPNVIYLLCYDSEILEHSIEQAAKVSSGRAYLEKIVQLTVMVPKPEPFQLRQWFAEELREIATTKNNDEGKRLKTIIDYEGGKQLKTPRSVVRALDSVRFYWPPLRDENADLADLVWLQLIKNGSPALYRWIEDYCGTAAALSLGVARVEDAERVREVATLRGIVGDDYFSDIHYRHHFSEQMSGIDVDFAADGEWFKLFQRVSPFNRDAAIREKRITSPDHYRLYFALGGPSYALTQADYDAVWAAANAGHAEISDILLRWHVDPSAGSLSKADLLLERIRGVDPEIITPDQSQNLLLAFTNCLDEAYRRRPFDRHWVTSLWDRAERLITFLLARLDPELRQHAVKDMFENGAAIDWLTHLFRRETFAQGRYGDRVKHESEWLFSAAEYDLIAASMIARYRAMSFEQIINLIGPMTLLFAWQQGGDEQGPRDLIGAEITDDTSLVRVLEALTTTVESSDRGCFEVLKRDNLDSFVDFADVRQRIEVLATQPDDSKIKERAKRLAAFFAEGDRY